MYKILLTLSSMIFMGQLCASEDVEKYMNNEYFNRTNDSKAHFDVEWASVLREATDNELKLYDNPELKGEVKARIDQEGLRIENIYKCKWYAVATFFKAKKMEYISLKKYQGKKELLPQIPDYALHIIKKKEEGEIDYGFCDIFHMWNTFLPIKSLNNGIAELEIDDKSYFMKQEYAPGKKFGPVIPSYKSFEKEVMETPEFKAFTEETKKCVFNRKKKNCTPRYDYVFEESFKNKKEEFFNRVNDCLKEKATVYDRNSVEFYDITKETFCEVRLQQTGSKKKWVLTFTAHPMSEEKKEIVPYSVRKYGPSFDLD